MKVCFLAVLAFPVLALAQQPTPLPEPPAKGQNLFRNGNFEKFTDEDNLWDGVDKAGLLAGDAWGEDASKESASPVPNGVFFARREGRRMTIDAVQGTGAVGRMAMPISVQAADLNHDGLIDLMTVDAGGYFRVYFNSGTPTAPKFTHGELVPLFLGRFFWPEKKVEGNNRSFGDALKMALGDFDRKGLLDLVLGNYYGDLMMIKNTGTVQVPEWKQPGSAAAITMPTTKDGSLWANLLAPAVADWDRDGKMDVLLGEGSYSANAVHLLLNATGKSTGGSSGFVGSASFTSQSKTSLPTFNEDFREYLAYGDGREQLVPAVVDYNGDGVPDLIVGDRTGRINVYLSDGPWKKGSEMKRDPQPISFGGVTSIGQGNPEMRCVAPAVADLNGDGKFDIIVGKPDGHIAVSYNIGTATEPKFGPLVDLAGEKVFPRGSIRKPADWSVNFGYQQGNMLGCFSVVNPQEDSEAAQATGKNVLRYSYSASPNRVIRRAPMVLSIDEGGPQGPLQAGWQPDNVTPWFWGWRYLRGGGFQESNIAVLRQDPGWNYVKPGARYQLSFRVKGRNVKKGHIFFLYGGWLVRDMVAARSATPPPDVKTSEAAIYEFDFPVTTSWTSVAKQISFRFSSQPDLNAFDKWNKPGSKIQYFSTFEMRTAVPGDDGVFYIDDLKLVEL